ncbi:tyrosine-type recombinase/integrase [Leifsonia poae]|uniref:tyrosine-type recombinase/integrase n=1 Tax=Leifsonia poae TaxID=110933 RepID=UPI003D6731DD
MGTVKPYDTSGGKRFRARWYNPEGRREEKWGFTTKREADDFVAQQRTSIVRGDYVEANAGRVTVAQLGAEWLAAQTRHKPSYRRTVESTWRIHVLPRWGDVQIGRIRHSAVRDWIAELTEEKSPSTVLRAHGILAAILDNAMADRLLSSNPSRGLKNLPRRQMHRHPYLTHAQVELLASHSREHATLVRFLAYTGLRWGEATGLRVQDLDALRRRVFVTENAVAVGWEIVTGSPKSHELRSVPVPAFLIEELSRLCIGKRRDHLIFGHGTDHVRSPDSRRGWYVAAIRDAQQVDPLLPRLTLHDLRHTAASLAVSAGANVKAVQRMLGHKSAAMTLDVYADLFDDDLDAVGSALDVARTAANRGQMGAKPFDRYAKGPASQCLQGM